jgi:acyl-CoA reductase-like NAD-dependent aldehyde dehydrogenase
VTAEPAGATGRRLAPHSPITGEEAGTVAITEPWEVEAVVARGREAFAQWSALTHTARRPYLRAFTRRVLRSMDRIADVMVAETGRDRGDAMAELVAALTVMDHVTRHAARMLRTTPGASWPFLTTRGWTEYQPLGVAGIISPWNYPFYLPIAATFQAIAAGCCAVLKPSEQTPLTGALIAELAREAGIPEGVIQVIQGYGDTGAALVASPTDIISFTGSTEVGKAIQAETAKTLKPLLLELGGKDAVVVLDDANLPNAARAAVTFGFFNAGQTCAGVERVYVVASVYDDFLDEMRRAVAAVDAGSGGRGDIGPMVSVAQVEKVEAHIADAVAKGARVLDGGVRRETEQGIYFEPTLVVDVDHSMVLMQDETFGPLVPVMKVADEEEAIRLANDCRYGLHGSVWTADPRRGRYVASRLVTGTVAINDHLINFFYPSIRFGGTRQSGSSAQLGEEALRSYCIHHGVTEARFRPTTKLLGGWLPRRSGPRFWKLLAKVFFGWRR